MDRKFVYLFTFLFSALFVFTPLHAAKKPKPAWDTTTPDGISLGSLKTENFKEFDRDNCIQVKDNTGSAHLSFKVNVPKGKVASLQYNLLFGISSLKSGFSVPAGSSIDFSVQIDKQAVVTLNNKPSISLQAQEVSIPGGTHDVDIDVRFNAKNCNTTGCIQNMSIHIHQFTQPTVTRAAICKQDGEGYYSCDYAGCNMKQTFKIKAEYNEHDMEVISTSASSCLSNTGSLAKCKRCPHKEIKPSGGMKDHDFDANGKCTVCGLSMPKCNAAGTVYTINNAGEMRALAEQMSLGRVSANIGIDIQSDLVFDDQTTMMPLGDVDHPFQGVINGNGHHISGISATYKGVDCLGFVGVAQGTLLSPAIIANLIFDASNTLDGEGRVGGIVGQASYCTIVNCASFGALSGARDVGGIVGYADQQVSLYNCAAVCSIRSHGNWNPMACGMPGGHILNSYGVGTNALEGQLDELPTATLRHCFSSQGSGEGLTQVSPDVLSSYAMVELLNEQSETPYFMMSDADQYPIPVVYSEVTAQPNSALPTEQASIPRRVRSAARAAGQYDEVPEKERQTVVAGEYVDESAAKLLGRSIEEVIAEQDSIYADYERMYCISRKAPEGAVMYEQLSGGEVTEFESYYLPADSSYLCVNEYEVVSTDRVIAHSQTVTDFDDEGEITQINVYKAENDSYTPESRIIFESEKHIVYEENIDGVMQKTWSFDTKYDMATGNALSTNVFSHDHVTGEARLEISRTFDSFGNQTDADTKQDEYEEYLDSSTNTIHIYYTYTDEVDSLTTLRDHYILRASDLNITDILTEKVIDGEPSLVSGIYVIYNDEGAMVQTVAYGPSDPEKPGSDLRPYLYCDYIGFGAANSYPTSIKVPTVAKPDVKKSLDANIYDMRGRVVRRVMDAKNPFSGLSHGVYIYQGAKYLIR